MGDTYRPSDRYRGRDYERQSYDADSEHRRQDRYRSRSPTRQHPDVDRRRDPRRSRSPARQYRDLDIEHRHKDAYANKLHARDLDYGDDLSDTNGNSSGGERRSSATDTLPAPRPSSSRRYDLHTDIDNYSGQLRYHQPNRIRNPSPLRRSQYDRYQGYYRGDTYRPSQPPNFGETDGTTDDQPSSYVLVRGLKETLTKELFAKGMEKLYDGFDNTSTGATPQSIWRVFIIRPRGSDDVGMGFGFVQYYTSLDAEKAVKKAHQMDRNGERLTIASKDIIVAFAHNGVFPHFDFGGVEKNEKFLFDGVTRKHKYYDERYYPDQMVVNKDPPYPKEPVTDEPATKKPKKAKKKTLETKSKEKTESAAMPAFLQRFQQKQAELREPEAETTRQEPKQPATGVNTISADTIMTDAPVDAADQQQTFAHESSDLITCYLCFSQFKTHDGIIRHLKESKMHKKYLEESRYIERAEKRMKDNGVSPDATIPMPPPEAPPAPVIRDRAAERRKQEMPTKIGFSLKPKGAAAGASSSSTTTPSRGVEKTPDVQPYGKGMGLLQKAGWTSGQPLGAAGAAGLTAPLAVSSFAPGVGLGHESSKQGDAVEEAARATKGNGFVEKGREITRRRFEEGR